MLNATASDIRRCGNSTTTTTDVAVCGMLTKLTIKCVVICLVPFWFAFAYACEDEQSTVQQYAAEMPAVDCSLVWQGDEKQLRYTLEVKNLSGKAIQAIEWKYLNTRIKSDNDWVDAVFYEQGFTLLPEQAKVFTGHYAFPKSKNKFLRGILNITKITFADGSQWVRQQDNKDTAYNRALLVQGLSEMEE